MAFLESIARQAAIKLQTGQLTPEQVRASGVTAFNLDQRALTRAATIPLEQNIAEEIEAEKERNSGLNKIGKTILKPLAQAGLAFVGGMALAPVVGAGAAKVLAPTLVSKLTSSPPPPPEPKRSPPVFEDIANPLGGLVNLAQSFMNLRTVREQAKLAPTFSDFGAAFPGGAPMGMQPAAFPIGALGGLARTLGGVGGAVIAGGRGLITTAGRALTSKKAVQLAKVLGVQGAATALGIGAVELADAVIRDQQRARRGRGISAAQLRTTRKTINKVMGAHRHIVQSCNSARVPRRRSAPMPAKRCR